MLKKIIYEIEIMKIKLAFVKGEIDIEERDRRIDRIEEIIYEEVVEYVHEETSRTGEVMRKQTFKEVERHLLCPAEGVYGIQIPAGTWHSIRVLEPTVIFEAKDGAYK